VEIKNLDLSLTASLLDNDDIQRQLKSLYCAANNFRGAFAQCSPTTKKHCFVPTACQCVLPNWGANTHW